MRHYNKIKSKYPDCVVFYRLGDFYEMFNDDAVRVSKMLDLTLTGRDCGLAARRTVVARRDYLVVLDDYRAEMTAHAGRSFGDGLGNIKIVIFF